LTKLFEPVKEGSVVSRVASAIRSAIFSGKLHPGDALLESQLAKDFQVSQTSVREALLQLEQFGLVRRVASRGTIVTQLSPQDVREHVELRTMLEQTAAVRAARQLTPEHFKELQKQIDEISRAVSANAYFESALADLDFHRCIWKASGNSLLYNTLDRIATPMFAFISIWRSSHHQDLKRVVHSHEEIVLALRKGEPKAVKASLKEHFDDSYGEFGVGPNSGNISS
jgi:DNA-binding GntR family transcriptional regulator